MLDKNSQFIKRQLLCAIQNCFSELCPLRTHCSVWNLKASVVHVWQAEKTAPKASTSCHPPIWDYVTSPGKSLLMWLLGTLRGNFNDRRERDAMWKDSSHLCWLGRRKQSLMDQRRCGLERLEKTGSLQKGTQPVQQRVRSPGALQTSGLQNCRVRVGSF